MSKRTYSLESFGVRLDPQMAGELDRWAKKAGVSRSELGRWGWQIILKRIQRLGRKRFIAEIEKGRYQGESEEQTEYELEAPKETASQCYD